jgi:putative phage-type endonuclease
MIFHDIEQNTPEWEQLRVGRVGASAFNNLTMKKNTAGYQATIARVAQEQVTGIKTESYKNAAMEAGHELESEAIQAYELETFQRVTRGGYYQLNDWFGCSPDGHAGNGIIEVKSLQYNTWQDYLQNQKISKQYYWQVQFQLFVTGADFCDFVVFQPNFRPIITRFELEKKEEIEKYMAEAEKDILERIKILEKWKM